MAAKDWSAAQYLKFDRERTRAVRDLVSGIEFGAPPKRIVDLGCGPGNSTEVVASLFPDASISAMDSSPDMLKKARTVLPDLEFTQGDLETYEPAGPVDLYLCNAVLQWIPTPKRLEIVKRLLQAQPSGAAFAYQVPNNLGEPSHASMREVAASGPWADFLASRKPDRAHIETPQQIYNALTPLCSDINIWQTVYYHVMPDHMAIVEWLKGSGLRPYVDPLSEEQRDGFIAEYLEKLKTAYPLTDDGKLLYPFPRLFVVATRK